MIYLLHGWNVRDRGEGTVGALARPLREYGHEVETVSYGWSFGYLQTRRRSIQVAETLAAKLRDGDIVIGHSNGCRIAYRASYMARVPLGPMVWIHPALDPWRVPAVVVPRCLVLYSSRDVVTRLASYIPFSPWGRMGTDGPRTEPWSSLPPDPRMHAADDGHRHSSWAKRPASTALAIREFLER